MIIESKILKSFICGYTNQLDIGYRVFSYLTY